VSEKTSQRIRVYSNVFSTTVVQRVLDTAGIKLGQKGAAAVDLEGLELESKSNLTPHDSLIS